MHLGSIFIGITGTSRGSGEMRTKRRIFYYINKDHPKALHISGFPWRSENGYLIGKFASLAIANITSALSNTMACKIKALIDDALVVNQHHEKLDFVYKTANFGSYPRCLFFKTGYAEVMQIILSQIWPTAGGNWLFVEHKRGFPADIQGWCTDICKTAGSLELGRLNGNYLTFIYSVDDTELVFRDYMFSREKLLTVLKQLAQSFGYSLEEEKQLG